MSLRYAIEVLVYFVILITFQYKISAFNQNLGLAIKELAEFDLLNEEIIKKGGEAYDPNNPHRHEFGELHDGRHEIGHVEDLDEHADEEVGHAEDLDEHADEEVGHAEEAVHVHHSDFSGFTLDELYEEI